MGAKDKETKVIIDGEISYVP